MNRLGPKELAELLDVNSAPLELFAAQWTPGYDDCVQEAFIKLATHSPPPANPVAWLYRVVRNLAINQVRSAKRRTNHEKLAGMLFQAEDRANPETLSELAFSLDQISASDRELIVLRIWSQFTWDQIAKLTGTSSSSAQRKYVAALKRLKEILEPCQKTST